LLAAGQTPLVVGGTGLYLRAAVADLDFAAAPTRQLREHWLAELASRGVRELHVELSARAPLAAARIDANDRSRVVRALELADMGNVDGPPVDSQLWAAHTRRPTTLVGLTMDREALYARIDARVEAMVAAGALAEVRAADAAGASITARRALGFDELLADDVEGMKRRTRRYAKRQLTWMRKLSHVKVIDVTGLSPDEVAGSLVMIPPPAGADPWPEGDDMGHRGSEARE
jgi:tRNA dimethylallyltransferase